MTALPWIDIVGYWIGIFLTFCCLSFLYKDNPFYKLAEHLFIGVSVGYLIVLQYGDNIEPKVIDAVFRGGVRGGWWVLRLIALVLVLLMFVKVLVPRWSWLGRYPLAFVVAFYAGLQINAVAPSLSAETLSGDPSSSAQYGMSIMWQPMSPNAPVPKSHQPRHLNGTYAEW